MADTKVELTDIGAKRLGVPHLAGKSGIFRGMDLRYQNNSFLTRRLHVGEEIVIGLVVIGEDRDKATLIKA